MVITIKTAIIAAATAVATLTAHHFFSYEQRACGYAESYDRGTSFAAWSGPTNVYSSNNTYAQSYIAGTDELRCSSFGFTIPSGATITNIKVVFEGNVPRYETAAESDTAHIKLLSGGSLIGNDMYFDSGSFLLADDGSDSLGIRDTTVSNWGVPSITDSTVNSSGFGVSLWTGYPTAANTFDLIKIDYVEMWIVYELGDKTFTQVRRANALKSSIR